MSASPVLFQASPSIKKAVGIINRLEQGKFTKVLTRVSQRFHLKDEPIFTEDECERLQSGLGVESQELELVLDTISFFLQQAAYHLAKPAVFQKQLQEVGLSEENSSLFSRLWSASGKNIVEELRSKQFYPVQLEDVKWRLNLRMSQANLSQLKEPNAMFEFTVSDNTMKDNIRLEFNHSELYNFYEKLEVIQEQLDSLN